MTHAEQLNKQLSEDFYYLKTYSAFEKYSMSELLSPIEDYYNFIKLVQENCGLLKNNNLLYIAAYLNSYWHVGNKFFIDKLNKIIDNANQEAKAIIYYLDALEIHYTEPKDIAAYVELLQKSVRCSQNFKFVNNRIDLAKNVEHNEAKKLLNEAKQNIIEILSDEAIAGKGDDYWVSSERYIEEFILGTTVTELRYNNLLKNIFR